MAGHAGERSDRQRLLDPGDRRQNSAKIRRDLDVVAGRDVQVELGQPEHVEVELEAWSSVEPLEDTGDAGRAVRRRERSVRHRPAGQPFQHHHVPRGEVQEHPRAYAGTRGCPGVV